MSKLRNQQNASNLQSTAHINHWEYKWVNYHLKKWVIAKPSPLLNPRPTPTAQVSTMASMPPVTSLSSAVAATTTPTLALANSITLPETTSLDTSATSSTPSEPATDIQLDRATTLLPPPILALPEQLESASTMEDIEMA